ncbi:hypothetical protein HME9304_02673 [Flagellimonas maritima]|uniref:Uncharacterized protein n=1 Tax=Flagellimonas maritima TaxID=1383885 RepID=A0A2Z4LUZ8_9FLAO|nr:hypothetical protein [Allomuricauda aurantiaca]AWX45646.1 hypothetical protein HME9304_02673 [Allomuricauda aurantiaca]
MLKNNVFGLIIILINFMGYSQKEHEFLGFLKLNDTALVSYNLKLQLIGENVEGYSVTNLGGPHETKSYVKGTYNDKTNEVYFFEYGIEYTKSDLDTYDFCFVHFMGNVRNIESQNIIKGNFEGKFEDGVPCINGELMVRSIKKVYAKTKKVDKKIQRVRKIPDSIKQNINLTKIIDGQRLNMLKVNETTTIFVKNDEVELIVWDSGKVDGDIISVDYNNTSILKRYSINKEKRNVKLSVEENMDNIITVKAENLGEISPNTAKIMIKDGDRVIDLLSNLKKSEETKVILAKL